MYQGGLPLERAAGTLPRLDARSPTRSSDTQKWSDESRFQTMPHSRTSPIARLASQQEMPHSETCRNKTCLSKTPADVAATNGAFPRIKDLNH
jgi:hypothetical protein